MFKFFLRGSGTHFHFCYIGDVRVCCYAEKNSQYPLSTLAAKRLTRHVRGHNHFWPHFCFFSFLWRNVHHFGLRPIHWNAAEFKQRDRNVICVLFFQTTSPVHKLETSHALRGMRHVDARLLDQKGIVPQ